MTSKPLPAGYSFVDAPPDLETYLDLRRSSGLSSKSPAQGIGALTGSWAFCTVVYTPPSTDSGSPSESQVVGMTRVFGDGGWYFCIADMAVHPSHRRKGLAEGLLRRLLAKIKSDAPPDALITLSADEMGRELYRKCGFVETAPKSIGMWIGPEDEIKQID